MRTVCSVLPLLVVAALIGCNGSSGNHRPIARAAPWSQFRLNPRHEATLPGNLRASWRVQTDGAFSSSPAVVGNYAYIGNNAGTLYAIDVRTGAVRWRHHVAAALMSNPLVWNGLVIAGEGDQQYVSNWADLRHPFKIGATENALFAVDAATGALRWRTPLPGTGMPTPAIIDGRLIHHNGGGSILIVDPQSGKIEKSANADGVGTMSAILPVDDERFLTIGMFGGGPWILITTQFRTTVELRSAQTGDVIWSTAMPGNASGVGDCPPASASGVAVCDYVEVSTGISPGQRAVERAFAIDVDTGKIVWNVALEPGTLPTWNRAAIPLIVSDTAYLGSSVSPSVYALRVGDGALRWRLRVRGTVKGGISTKDRLLYFGDSKGYLWAVDARTGRVIGDKREDTKFNVGSSVIVGETLVIGSQTGAVIAIPLDVIRSSRDG